MNRHTAAIKNIFFVFFIALIVRTGYVWFFIESVDSTFEDQAMYIQLGQTMAETESFLQNTGNEYSIVTERVPGYPALLALVYMLFGENNMAVVIVQIFIDSLTCVIIGLIAELIVTRGFLVAGLISALNLSMITLSGMILTDTLFLFLFSLFILFVFRYLKDPAKLDIFLAASLLCVATLVRPVSYYLVLLLLPLLVGFLIWKRRPFKYVIHSSILYIIPIIVAFGSIHHRNFNEYNTFSLVSQGGVHAMYWVVPATYQYSGQGSYQEGQAFAKKHIKHAMIRDNIESLSDNPFENSGYHMKIAKQALLELGVSNILHAWSVGAIVNFLLPSAAYAPAIRAMEHPSFYATPGNGVIEKLVNYISNTNGFIYLLIITVGSIISLIFLVISIFGFYKMLKSSKLEDGVKEIIFFSLLISTYFIAITGPIIGVKYRLPVELIMTIFFSYVWVLFRKKKGN